MSPRVRPQRYLPDMKGGLMGLSFALILHREEPTQGITVVLLRVTQGYHKRFLQELTSPIITRLFLRLVLLSGPVLIGDC